MDRTVDTSRTIVVTGSTLGTRWRLVWYSAGLLLWSGLIALLIVLLRAAGEWSIDPVPYYALFGLGCFLVFFFAVLVMLCLSTILESRKFLKISGNVLTITPNGIRDRRLTEEFVPWPFHTNPNTMSYLVPILYMLCQKRPLRFASLSWTSCSRSTLH